MLIKIGIALLLGIIALAVKGFSGLIFLAILSYFAADWLVSRLMPANKR